VLQTSSAHQTPANGAPGSKRETTDRSDWRKQPEGGGEPRVRDPQKRKGAEKVSQRTSEGAEKRGESARFGSRQEAPGGGHQGHVSGALRKREFHAGKKGGADQNANKRYRKRRRAARSGDPGIPKNGRASKKVIVDVGKKREKAKATKVSRSRGTKWPSRIRGGDKSGSQKTRSSPP